MAGAEREGLKLLRWGRATEVARPQRKIPRHARDDKETVIPSAARDLCSAIATPVAIVLPVPRCLPRRDLCQLHHPAPERAGSCVVAVPGVGRAVADLRRHADRQFCAWLALHAGVVRRLQPDRGAGADAAGILDLGRARGAPRRRRRGADRGAGAAPHLQGARAVPAARHLRRRPGDQGHRAVRVGRRGPGRPARARPVDGGRDPGPAHPRL